MVVNEIFQSIDGEAARAGKPTNFIRLAHCNLRCLYCDTKYAQEVDNGTEMDVEEVMNLLNKDIKNVTLTGGEPLLHTAEAFCLLNALITEGYKVSVETNGSMDLNPFIEKFPEVTYIMDYKLPSSHMESLMDKQNLRILRPGIDIIKFVAGTKADLWRFKHTYTTYLEGDGIDVYLSPTFGELEPKDLVEYVMSKRLYDITVQVQLHKIIWNPNKRGV